MITFLPFLLTILIPSVQSAALKRDNDPVLKNALFTPSKANGKMSASSSLTTNEDDVKPEPKQKDIQLDLSDFSDDELIRLAEVLQDELKNYEQSEESVSALAAEPLVLMPSELAKEDLKQQREYSRPRRSKPHSKMILEHVVPAELLEKLTQPEPIIVLPEMEDDDSPQQNGPTYLTVKASAKQMPMSVSELDEFELRLRISQLSDLLRERALRDL